MYIIKKQKDTPNQRAVILQDDVFKHPTNPKLNKAYTASKSRARLFNSYDEARANTLYNEYVERIF